MTTPPRRIVTGHDPQGRSFVLSDAPVPRLARARGLRRHVHEVWRTGASPAPIAPTEPEPTEGEGESGLDDTHDALR